MEENPEEEGGGEEPVDLRTSSKNCRKSKRVGDEDNEVEVLAEYKAEGADQMVGKGLQKQVGADRFKDRAEIDKIKSN